MNGLETILPTKDASMDETVEGIFSSLAVQRNPTPPRAAFHL